MGCIMANTLYEESKLKAEIISELRQKVKQQLTGEMDWVRARAYWESRLPGISPDILAGALADAICSESRLRMAASASTKR